jgi:hypothetical protein
MLRILVANKSGRRGLDHDCGPLEFGRGPRREAPRLSIDDPAEFRTIDRPLRAPGSSPPGPLSALREDPTPEQLACRLESLVTVERPAASSPDFYSEAARAVVELIGLVLLRRGGEWEVIARHGENRPWDSKRVESRSGAVV